MMTASPSTAWVMRETMGAVSPPPQSFVNIDITRNDASDVLVPYCNGQARPDGGQGTHTRRVAPGRRGAIPGPGRGRHVGRTDCRRCRGLTTDVLPTLQLQA